MRKDKEAREIKFRAWSPEEERMATWDDLNTIDSKTVAWCYSNEYWILMQYTGLKDRHGKEIYEGDIVANWYLGQQKICEILFIQGCFVVRYKEQLDPISDHYCEENESCSWLEKIGNLYETPELLK